MIEIGATTAMATYGTLDGSTSSPVSTGQGANDTTSAEVSSSGLPMAVCGNAIQEAGEDCDDTDLGGASCENTNSRFNAGWLACNDDCTFDTSNCLAVPNPYQLCEVVNLAIPEEAPPAHEEFGDST